MATYFVYDDNPVRAPGKTKPYMEQDATKYYLKHVSNEFYLRFIATHPDCSFIEKRRAEHELQICLRKQGYWKKHPNWDLTIASRGTEQIKRNWEQKRK